MRYHLDNFDLRIPYYKLRLHRPDLINIPVYVLPEGYHYEFYQPGDRDAWIEIEKSSKECSTYEEAIVAWNKYFAPYESLLSSRMIFIVTDSGRKVATASAYFDVHGLDPFDSGRLHWVAVHRDFQGKGLSRPLLSKTMTMMSLLDVAHAYCNTSTRNWVACRLYLDFGFLPENVEEEIGWRIMKTLTNHPVLNQFKEIDLHEWIK
ncbi:MAG: GNAT family N-acetyltransferase [Erysipelotrichaceae bacterium]|nr:GNAT family N-acetyltransferase [Erysipelotrichaceae bacterium]